MSKRSTGVRSLEKLLIAPVLTLALLDAQQAVERLLRDATEELDGGDPASIRATVVALNDLIRDHEAAVVAALASASPEVVLELLPQWRRALGTLICDQVQGLSGPEGA
jgi:hypothetical protein